MDTGFSSIVRSRRVLALLFTVILFGGIASTASNTYGIDIWQGEIRMHGNDIVDGGSTIWDASNGYIPASQVNDGSGSGLDADTLDGIDSSNIDTNSSTACTGSQILLGNGTCGNAGDGYLPNDPPSTNIDMNGKELQNLNKVSNTGSFTIVADSDGNSHTYTFNEGNGRLNMSSRGIEGIGELQMTGDRIDAGGSSNQINLVGIDSIVEGTLAVTGTGLDISSQDEVRITTNADATSTGCTVTNSGDLNCDGTKSWSHDLNSTHEAVYTSQESPQVRAVFEGQVQVEDGRVNYSLPSHFEKTVSESDPMLRAQATPHELATVAVTQRTDSWIVIESSKDTTVDLRVTGVREGYEDRKVVRPKEN